MAAPVKQALAQAEELARPGGSVVTAAHLFLAILERSPGVVRSAVPSIDPEQKKAQLKEQLEAAPQDSDESLAQALQAAVDLATQEGKEEAQLQHVIRALAGVEAGQAAPPPAPGEPAKPPTPARPPAIRTPTLDKFGRDLTREAQEEGPGRIFGRNAEIDQVIQSLCRMDKPNVLLVGPAGVGKTAIVEGLAQRIASEETPPYLDGSRVVELQPSTLVAGTQMMGSLQERMTKILEELQKARADEQHAGVILFVDEFHTAVGAGGPMGLQDIASQLKPALDRGEIACIGATTNREYEQHLRRDEALERRFDVVRVAELSPGHTLELLKLRRPRWERGRGVSVSDDALQEAVYLAGNHMKNRHFPDKGIDVVEQAVALVYTKGGSSVEADAVREIVAKRIGQPVGTLQRDLSARLEGMADFLKSRVIGQDHVIDPLVELLTPKLLGLDISPERPNGVLFFTGPTGVGKTELAKNLAEFLYGSKKRLLRFDMSEFSEPHEVAVLKGAPPGYIGFDMGSPLLDQVMANPFSVVLLDEVEKAHRAVHQLFLQVFDAGVLTDAQGRHIYFSDVVVIMTSNIQEFTRRGVGFVSETEHEDPRATLRRHFPAEFVNRVDYVGLFHDLPPEVIRDILDQRVIPEVQERWRRQGLELEVSPEAAGLIAKRGLDEQSGARELRRVMDEEVASALTRFLPEARPDSPLKVRVSVSDGSLTVKKANK